MPNTRMKAWLTRPGGLASELAAARGTLSMRQMASALGPGWTSSKVSKLENGDQLITDSELSAWIAATQADEAVRERWFELLAEAQQKRSLFRRRRPPVGDSEHLPEALEREAGHITVISPYAIPELLQTKEYAGRLADEHAAADFVAAWKRVAARQAYLTESEKTFDFLIPEAALRMVPGSTEVMAGQLDRLISAGAMGNVNVRVLALLTPLPTFPLPGSVAMYDDEVLIDDGVEARHYTGSDAEAIADRLNVLWESAATGQAARSLILAAVADLSEAF
jgi:hypothetical protein